MFVAGSYDCVTKTPMGPQKGVLTIVPGEGDTFTGNITGDLGSMDIEHGTVSGNTLTWQMKMTVPMPMTLEGEATVDGDTITGGVKAGAFGTFAMSGTRKG